MPKPNTKMAAEVFSVLTNDDNVALDKVMEILLSEINPFPAHPFKIKEIKAMRTMLYNKNAKPITPWYYRLCGGGG